MRTNYFAGLWDRAYPGYPGSEVPAGVGESPVTTPETPATPATPAKNDEPELLPAEMMKRRACVRRRMADLRDEVGRSVKPGILDWSPLGGIVDVPERELFNVTAQYVAGGCDKEVVECAWRYVRNSWWLAASLYLKETRAAPVLIE